MEVLELLNIISLGETSKVQFKELIDNQDSVAAEMIALSNSRGGIILFGIKDKTGELVGLNYQQLQETNQKIANIATNLVKPQIFITTEAVQIIMDGDNKNILIVYVDEGCAKPYKDTKGQIWVKQGSDKRKLTDNNEILRLFQQSGLVYIDEMIVPGSSLEDINITKVQSYLEKIGVFEDDIPVVKLCQNINIIKNESLTLGGLLFFSKNPQSFRSAFCVKAISFIGNDISGTDYRDSIDIKGVIPDIFEQSISFFTRNLRYLQKGQNFNSIGILEISQVALEELVQNALMHRDYSKNSPIRMFIFDNRIEIISPGVLPNSLTIENIKMGNAVVRNPLVVSYASKLMRYRGVGSGISRALREQPNIEFINDIEGEQFKVIIPRPE